MPPPIIPVEAEAALRRFRQFYEELFIVKRLLHEGDWAALLGRRAATVSPAGSATASPIGNAATGVTGVGTGNAAGSIEEQVLLVVRLRLRNAIAAQGFGGTPSLRSPAGVDPGYVWAAVADAALLHDVSWAGREGWGETPLEVVLYRSRIAGDRIFQAIDELTMRHTSDPDGVAMTILLALEMGFRGRYHGNDDRGEIDRLKARLFDVVFRAPLPSLRDFDGLTVGATEALGARVPAQLPTVRPWRLAIAGVVVGYMMVSRLIWWQQVGDIVRSARDAVSSLSLLG